MSGELLQIVPMLPPALSGVGDFALLLARQLATAHGVQTRFLNGDPTWTGGPGDVAPFPVASVRERSTGAMLEALENTVCDAALLHYVGYGYEKRGCPLWLVRAMERWKQRTGKRLIVLFHEVSGSGPIWTSGFWTAGLQTSLARRLARLGDTLRITTEVSARRVRAMLPTGSPTPLRVLPVFSTLGEPATVSSYRERLPHLVVFGSANWRRDAYTRHLPTLQNVCRTLRMEKVIDIGSPVGMRPALDVPFVEAGPLPAADASELMRASAVGFFTYPVLHIGKSTIFAAYCAHGLAPVTFPENAFSGDSGLEPGKHFLTESVAAGSSPEKLCAEVARNAWGWYQGHQLEDHAREIIQTVIRTT